jgi:hypothetical protein
VRRILIVFFGFGFRLRPRSRGRRGRFDRRVAEHRQGHDECRARLQGLLRPPHRPVPISDVSSKSQATALHVNYSAEVKAVKGLPEQYFVRGRAAKGQLTIFGSQPGEADYNPLWKEVWLTWRKGVKPVLIGQDDQIDALEKKGKLTEKDAHIVLYAPILSAGKGG